MARLLAHDREDDPDRSRLGGELEDAVIDEQCSTSAASSPALTPRSSCCHRFRRGTGGLHSTGIRWCVSALLFSRVPRRAQRPDARQRVRLQVAADRASSKRIGGSRNRGIAGRLGRWLISPGSTRLPEPRLAVATAAVAVGTLRVPVVLSRASLPVASWRAPLGALRWPGRLRSCSRRGLACSSGSQHRDRSAA